LVPSGQRNKPVWALFKLQLKKIIPTELLHDPYIVALLIAMAQKQRATLQLVGQGEKTSDAPGSNDLSTFSVRFLDASTALLLTIYLSIQTKLLFTEMNVTEYIHLFTADIPSSFLDKFDYPALPSSVPVSISIQHTTIPLKPFKTIRDRLLALILPTPHDQGRKRKRKQNGRRRQSEPSGSAR
jgi:hypothetical protein